MSWLKNAIHQSTKPKESVIGVLLKNLGGQQRSRPRNVLHASDISQPDFCPRQWALLDKLNVKSTPRFLPVALDVTFQLGCEMERLVVEEWGGSQVIGNWKCRLCGSQFSMCPKPNGKCKDGRSHWWEYLQFTVITEKYGLSGGIDCLFDVGSPRLLITEVKIMNPVDFDKIVAPLSEHRLRTNLYMKLIDESTDAYKGKINVEEARVLYVSRAYGRMNPQWNEILPFREFEIKRNDEDLIQMLKRAKSLKLFREEKQGIPSGICDTATDVMAKKCNCVQACFSGDYPATIQIDDMVV